MATEDWSVYRRFSIIAINWTFSSKRLNQNWQTRAWNEGNYQGYIESENFGQSRSFVAFKMATEDWSVYRHVSIIAINCIFSPKRLNRNFQTRAWNEGKLPRIHWIRKFWPISKFCCLQNGRRRLVGLPAGVNNRYNWIFSPKRLNRNLQTRAWNEEKLLRIHWIRKFWLFSNV